MAALYRIKMEEAGRYAVGLQDSVGAEPAGAQLPSLDRLPALDSSATAIIAPSLPKPEDEKDHEHKVFYAGAHFSVYRGVLLLQRMPGNAEENPALRSLTVLAVPARYTVADFCQWLGEYEDACEHVRFLRDSDPSRFVALLQMRTRKSAQELLAAKSGQPFNALTDEMCHIMYLHSAVIDMRPLQEDSIAAWDRPSGQGAASSAMGQVSVRPHRPPSPPSSAATATAAASDTVSSASSALAASTAPILPFAPFQLSEDCLTVPETGASQAGDTAVKNPSTQDQGAEAAAASDGEDEQGALFQLPTCVVCLERMDCAITGLVTTACNHSFHRRCLARWDDSTCPVCRFTLSEEEDTTPVCMACGSHSDLWMCLICGHVGCGRYNACHALDHFNTSGHAYALEVSTQRVWDYAGDGFVHRLIQNRSDGKLVELPDPRRACDSNPPSALSTPTNAATVAAGDAAGDLSALQRSRQGPATDLAPDEAVSEKMTGLAYEYNTLLTSQLEVQRQYFESRVEEVVMEAASQSEQISQQLSAAQQELEHVRGALAEKEREADVARKRAAVATNTAKALQEEVSLLRELNNAMEANQEQWHAKVAASSAAAGQSQAAAQAEIEELKAQVRDLMFSLEARAKIEASPDAAEIREGVTLVTERSGGGGSGKKRRGRRRG